jgi:hypothetical protein
MASRYEKRKQMIKAAEFGLDPDLTRTVVKLPLGGEDCPNWLSHIEFSREGDHILFEVVKTNGFQYGEAKLSLEEFNNMADLLLTP